VQIITSIKQEKVSRADFDVEEAMPGGLHFDVANVGFKVQVFRDYGVRVHFVVDRAGNTHDGANIVVETPALEQLGTGYGVHKPVFTARFDPQDEKGVARFRRIHSHLQGTPHTACTFAFGLLIRLNCRVCTT